MISVLQPEVQVSVPDIWQQLETAAHSIRGMADYFFTVQMYKKKFFAHTSALLGKKNLKVFC